MPFISVSFLIFFLILVSLYHLSARFAKNAVLLQNILLLASSLVFYAFANLRFLPFLLYTIAISYAAVRFCKSKLSFAAFLVADLAPLLALKYCPLILHTQWIFPLGISFFTFQSVSFISDSYTKKIPTEQNFLNVALFISFFPVISSGPIQRAGNLIPQFRSIHHFDYDNATDGMKLFAWGLFKKLCVADRIAVYVNYVYGNAADKYGLALILATALFSFQLYCDFSGYSDMAIGIARYLGFDVGKNFDHPYLSQSVGEFWRKWHISLSSCLRDYIYIPLGGSRVALPRIYLNLLATFLISGIWHGSTLNFVIWGLLHGFYLCLERAMRPTLEKARIPAWIKIFVTFSLVSFAWIFFRAQNLHEAGIIIGKIVRLPLNFIDFFVLKEDTGIKDAVKELTSFTIGNIKLMVLFLFSINVIEIITRKKPGLQIIKELHPIIRWALYVLLLYCIMFCEKSNANTEFLYFAF